MIRAAVLAFSSLLIASSAHAGQECGAATMLGAEQTRKAFNQAYATLQRLEVASAKVAMLARVGSDQSANGMRYTHLGYALKDHAKGKWIIVHLLNECQSAASDIFDEGLANFFMDDPFSYETLVLVPPEVLQNRLEAALTSPAVKQLHAPSYSLIANAWSTKYQNSNQWGLELMAAAFEPKVQTREDAQAWLKLNGYQPHELYVSALKRLAAKVAAANVQFDDHSFDQRVSGRYQIVSVESVEAFLMRYAPQTQRFVVPDASPSQM